MTARQFSSSSATRICPEDRGGTTHIPRSENLKLRTTILVRYCRFHTFEFAAVQKATLALVITLLLFHVPHIAAFPLKFERQL